MSYFNKFFGIYGDNKFTQINFLGKKFIIRKNNFKKMSQKELLYEINSKLDYLISKEDDYNRLIQENISTALLHQKTFLPYKNIHQGENITLVGTGPSINYFHKPKNMLYIGVNKSYKIENIDFNYYFIQDYYAAKPYIEEVIEKVNCQKFFGYTYEFSTKKINRVIPEELAIKANAKRYRTNWAPVKNIKHIFVQDISTKPLCCHGSVVFPALQFAFWTNPQKIYLAGCDCTNDGYFDSSKQTEIFNTSNIKEGYIKLKHFRDIYYPNTEIISINPIGLKGIFKDVYTRSFIEKHPELQKEDIEIID